MFGQEAYLKILRAFIDGGFSFSSFCETKLAEKSVYLRHDIDFSVIEALKMAKLEYREGVKATYFFMLSSNMYNLLSEDNQNAVREIRQLGHDISLHFDPTVYTDIDAGFQSEKLIFESAFNVDVKMVSIHRPGDFLNDNNRKLSGSRHSYEDDFFKKVTYISDSGGRDISQKLLELSQSRESLHLHLLIHPIWWTNLASAPTETLNAWLASQHAFLIEETRRNCKTFKG